MEQVWGITRRDFEGRLGAFQGFRSQAELPSDCGSLRSLASLLTEVGEFRPRPEAEEDPSFKQVIPYVVVRFDRRYLLVERLSAGGEARLHHQESIGIGGHINPGDDRGPDQQFVDPLVGGLRRELREELRVADGSPISDLTFLGLINDDSNPVGQVHLGVACRWDVAEPVEIREKDRLRGEYRTSTEILDRRDRLETWSELLLSSL